VSFLGKVSVVDRILVSLSHVRRAQSSPLNEVPNFLESRSASHSVFLTISRNSDIDASGACGEYSFGKLGFILNLEWSSRVPTYEFLFCFLGTKRCIRGIVQTNRVFQSTGCGSIRESIRLRFYAEFDYHSYI